MTQGWWAWLKPLSPAVLCLFFSAVQPWGWRAGIVLGSLGILAVLIGVRHLYEREQARFRIREAETSLGLLERKRHDWMNHVQVIMGYLSMKQIDRIRPYLEQLVKQAQRERSLSQVKHPPLAVALVSLPHRFPEWDWEVEMGEGFQSIPSLEAERICQMVEEAAEEMGRMVPPEDRTTVRLRFDKGEDGVIFSVHVSRARKVLAKGDWNRMKKRIESWQGKFQVFDGGFMAEIPLEGGKSPGNRLLSWGR
ncbi:MAG: Spo0B domain-containing protein [Planifilum fimeticola]